MVPVTLTSFVRTGSSRYSRHGRHGRLVEDDLATRGRLVEQIVVEDRAFQVAPGRRMDQSLAESGREVVEYHDVIVAVEQ